MRVCAECKRKRKIKSQERGGVKRNKCGGMTMITVTTTTNNNNNKQNGNNRMGRNVGADSQAMSPTITLGAKEGNV